MEVGINGHQLVIAIGLEQPVPPASGKILVAAGTRGNAVTAAKVDGKPVIIAPNATIKP